MSVTTNSASNAVLLDNSVGLRLLVEVPSEQEKTIRNALNTLSRTNGAPRAQTLLLDAEALAAPSAGYFWTPEWQAGEREAELDYAEGRVQTFDTMEEMLDFLNAV